MSDTVPPKVYELIKQVIDDDLKNFSINVHDPNEKSDGNLGEMCYVTLRNKNNGNTFNFAVKQAPFNESARELNPIRNAYMNEIYFYTKIWPCFQQFQKNLPTAKASNKVVKCYGTSNEDHFEILLLENIKLQNFITFDKRRTFDEEHIEYIFEEYGKYHALSFAYRALNPEEYSKITKELKDLYKEYLERESIRGLIKGIHELCLNSLQPGKDDDVIQKYKYYIENAVRIYSNSNNYTGNYSVILHGDCWSSNMMFKYNESGKLSDMRFLDFQLVKDGNPVSDLAYCLYSGGSKEIFDKLDYYLKVYHDSLSETITEFGLDSAEIYPFEVLKHDWKQHCQLGFTMALPIWQGKLKYQNDTDSQDRGEDFNETYDYDHIKFKKITRDLILHMYENDFLINY